MIRNLIFTIHEMLWSKVFIIILITGGLYLTFILRAIQFRNLFLGFKKILQPNKQGTGDISSFQALMTALAGAIGTGNIAGIGTAVVVGGFGALFWMWVVSLIGMATAYSETLLGLKYKQINADGEVTGGPMYTLKYGLNANKAAILFACFGFFSSLGYCLVQSNSVVDAFENIYMVDRLTFGVGLAVVSGLVIIGGVKTIGRFAGIIVPFMALAYLLSGLYILVINYQQIVPAIKLIFVSAFNGQAAAGGFLGSTIMLAIQNGAQYGIFANEAGLGSYSISGACSNNAYPSEQGMLSISGVFISTMVVCTITGLVLAVTNVLGTYDLNGKVLTGAPLALSAFSTAHDYFKYVVLFGLLLFAFTTILAWAYYGEKCVEFLFGLRVAHFYRWLYLVIIIVGSLLELEIVWSLAHIGNGLMTLPNLYSLINLAPIIKKETQNYLRNNTY